MFGRDGMFGRLGRKRAPWTIPYDPRATEDDILYCFRLILGRQPHREEWQGHTMRVGEDVSSIVGSYLGSLEFANRGLFARARGPVEMTEQQGFKLFSASDDAAVGKYVRADNYESEVTSVFRQFLSPAMSVIDIGANIGYFTMLSAAIVGASGFVLAIEPNPANVALLEASRRANGFGQVTVAQIAAGRETGILVLHSSHSNGTTSSVPDDLDLLLASQTVPCIPLDALVPAERRIDFIKVDVEGAEYNALLGARRTIEACRPVLVSEFSPELMPGISGIDGPHYLNWLIGQGYELSVIQADGTLKPRRADWQSVMDDYRLRGTDHIDILATPVS